MNGLQVDENLIAAALRLIDGGTGHHHRSTVAMYRAAARAGDVPEFALHEDSLRKWIIFRAGKLMPDSWRYAVDKLARATQGGVPCEYCGNYKEHGEKCPGNGEEPCWPPREPCAHHDGKCCHCSDIRPT